MEYNKKLFQKMLINKRKELGMTQKQFGDHLFVSRQLISKWERGERIPDWEQVKVLFGKLELDPKCLVLDELAISISHERKRRALTKAFLAGGLLFSLAFLGIGIAIVCSFFPVESEYASATSCVFHIPAFDICILLCVFASVIATFFGFFMIKSHYKKIRLHSSFEVEEETFEKENLI